MHHSKRTGVITSLLVAFVDDHLIARLAALLTNHHSVVARLTLLHDSGASLMARALTDRDACAHRADAHADTTSALPPKRPADNDLTGRINTVNLKNTLGQIPPRKAVSYAACAMQHWRRHLPRRTVHRMKSSLP
jgi:hypothetical protein